MVPDCCVHQLHFHKRVFTGEFTPDGKYFITSSQDFQVRVFDGNKIEQNKTESPVKNFHLANCGWAILDVAISPKSDIGRDLDREKV